MASAFANISFTDNVKQFQSKMGSRQHYQQFEMGENETVKLTEFEKAFIEQRDSFYQATVSQNGWPYVQHRGGPIGFLKVIDDQTIGYADFTGNRQYLSVGNLSGDERICLFLMDYQLQRRLKIWGRARLVDPNTESALIAQLEPANFRAPVERGIVINIEAFDWNCPKYITPRFTKPEVEAVFAEQQLSKENIAYHYPGTGTIPVVITAVAQVTNDVRTYHLSHREQKPLPSFQAGAHINVPVQTADGSKTIRSYSLINTNHHADNYQVAVKLDKAGKGGSAAIHQHWQVGTQLNIDAPNNYFGLHQDSRPALLIAGGIGITAIMAMAAELKQKHVNFELHYTSQTPQQMAFKDQVLNLFQEECHLYFSRTATPNRLDINELIKTASAQIMIYVCGPKTLIQQALQAAENLDDNQRKRIHFESFQ